ncbi:hypothetical protein [Acidicapsa acidisoli]|uniref:hypothetical protein n=1 Tax=Acidicapsa acidisoli TaxID=1615681 RepID=UPI0021DFFE4B|nr:hypothetical protein [Acidicapsa acidisoli]
MNVACGYDATAEFGRSKKDSRGRRVSVGELPPKGVIQYMVRGLDRPCDTSVDLDGILSAESEPDASHRNESPALKGTVQ